MKETRLGDARFLRVMRCEGGLHVKGANTGEPLVLSEVEPQVRRLNGHAEVALRGNAELRIPSRVALEILDCGSDLCAENYTGPLVLGRIRGSLSLKRTGPIRIRGQVEGNLSVEHGDEIEGEQVDGSLRVDGARAVRFRRIAGDAECRTIEHDAWFEDVLGRLLVLRAGGRVTVRGTAGEVEIETAATVCVTAVAGNLKATDIDGVLRIGKTGGQLVADDVRGGLTADSVGGHARLRRVGGDVELAAVAGAVRLMGPFPTRGGWGVKSSGPITVEVPVLASIELSACAPRGQVRFRGIPEQGMRREAGGRVKGRFGTGGLELVLITTAGGIDLIGASPDSCARRRSTLGESDLAHRFKAPVEALANELREDVSGLVNEIARAAGRVVAESEKRGGAVAHELARGLGEAVRELERTVRRHRGTPREVSETLGMLGRRISGLARRATEQAERRSGQPPADAVAGRESPAPGASAPDENHDETLVKILRAVRDGMLTPEQADRLITAWAELCRQGRDRRNG